MAAGKHEIPAEILEAVDRFAPIANQPGEYVKETGTVHRAAQQERPR